MILVTSRNSDILEARIHVLESAGYLAVGALTLEGALTMASLRRPNLVVVGHTFAADEQAAFVNELRELHPDAHIVVLGPGVIQPLELADACTQCWNGQPGGSRLLRLAGDDTKPVLPWPNS